MKKHYVMPTIVRHIVETESNILAASDKQLEMEWKSGSSGKDASTNYEILSKEHSGDGSLWDEEE